MKTTLYSVLCIAIRLGAVLMAVNAVQQLPLVYVHNAEGGHVVALALLAEGVILLLAFVLWIRPGLLAWWALDGKRQEILDSPISPDQLQYVALCVLGVWVAIGGLAGCLGHAASILVIVRRLAYDGFDGRVPTSEWHWLVQYGVTLVAGLGLALGSRGLVGLLHRLRGYPHAMTAVQLDDTSHTQDG